MVQGGEAAGQSSAARVWLLALGMFAIGTDLFIVSGLLPALGHDLGLSVAAAGQTATAFAITYAIAAPVLASVTSKVDRRTLLIAVLLVFAAGNALSALAPNFAVLLISRAITGAGAALYAATASAVAAKITSPERRGRALAIVYAGMTSAIALGVPLGSAIGSIGSWRWAFGFVALLAVATVLGVWPSIPSVPGAPGVSVGQRLAAIRIKRAPSALLTTALWILGTFTVYTYLGTELEKITGAGSGERSWLLLLFGVGSFAGVMGGGRLADRVNPSKGLVATITLLAVVLAGFGLVLHSLAATAVGLVLWGLVHWSSFPLMQHRLLTIGGGNGDMLLALNNSAVYVGQTAAAVIGGLVVGAGEVGRLPYVGAGCEVLAVLALLAGSAGLARSAEPTQPASQPSASKPSASEPARASSDAT